MQISFAFLIERGYHMPKKVIKKIEQEYENKGKTPAQAKRIAYATLNKQGLLERGKKKRGKDRKSQNRKKK